MKTILISEGDVDSGRIRIGLRTDSDTILVADEIRSLHRQELFQGSIFLRGNLGMGRGDEYFDFTDARDIQTVFSALNVQDEFRNAA